MRQTHVNKVLYNRYLFGMFVPTHTSPPTLSLYRVGVFPVTLAPQFVVFLYRTRPFTYRRYGQFLTGHRRIHPAPECGYFIASEWLVIWYRGDFVTVCREWVVEESGMLGSWLLIAERKGEKKK